MKDDRDRASEREKIEQQVEEIEGAIRESRLRQPSDKNTRRIAELAQERGVLLWRLFQINTSQADMDISLNEINEASNG